MQSNDRKINLPSNCGKDSCICQLAALSLMLCILFTISLSLSCRYISLSMVPFSSFLLQQKCIPYYSWIVFHFIMYYFYSHSFVDGHMGCFQVLIIINSTAVNINILFIILSQWFFYSWDRHSRVESLDHVVVLFLIFENSSYCFPQRLNQFIFPRVNECFFFYTSLSALIFGLLDRNYSPW